MTGVTLYNRIVYQQRLTKQNVIIYTDKRLEAMLDSGAVVKRSEARSGGHTISSRNRLFKIEQL